MSKIGICTRAKLVVQSIDRVVALAQQRALLSLHHVLSGIFFGALFCFLERFFEMVLMRY